MKRIVIIGGCAAGPKAAAKAKRVNPENIVELYTEENLVSYSACGLPYYIGGVVPNINNLIVRTPEQFQKNGVKVFLNKKCVKILPDEKKVLFEDNTSILYDDLILCIGSTPTMPKIKNFPLQNIFHLKVLDDGIKIKQLATVSKSVVLIGAGYIAIELLEAFVKNKLKVTVIERKNKILPVLDDDISSDIKQAILERCNNLIDFKLNEEVVEFLGEEKFEGVLTRSGEKIYADFCVIATGVLPNVELAREAGIQIGSKGGIVVDKKMRTSISNIWAAGDCTEQTFIPTKQSVYMALGTIANKQARVAAINVNSDFTGVMETFDGVLGSMITKYCDFSIGATGMSVQSAMALSEYTNIKPISSVVDEFDKAGYMPQIGHLRVKLVADCLTGTILGAQVIGTGDVDKRISVVAAALRANLSLSEFLHLDLPYSPPFSSTIDPLLTAAYKLKQIMDD